MASTLVVFSDHGWGSACQPLQHLLLRLAPQHPVIFIEAPRRRPGRACLETFSPHPDVQVCRPFTPARKAGFHDGQRTHLHGLLRELVRDCAGHVAWLCTPAALPLLQALDPELVVADCSVDPLVPRQALRRLRQRERALLEVADLVLTVGPRQLRVPGTYRSRREPQLHCLTPGVDLRHFEPALDRANSHPLHRDIPGPRLGYHGVIDDRIDLDLIRDLADAHPRWQIVLVGPVVGIPSAALPRRPNIHYFGPQPHEALPRFLAGWDVCLLPYARQAAARRISPVTALEYMAAELPIVGTPLPDLAALYADAVVLAANAPGFVAACERVLLARPEERAGQVAAMRKLLAAASWDTSAAELAGVLRAAVQRKQVRAAHQLPPPAALNACAGDAAAHAAV